MIKECRVVLNNDLVTVVLYDDVYVQLPSIHRNSQTVYVDNQWGFYSVVDNYTPPEEEPVEEDDQFERAMNVYMTEHGRILTENDIVTIEEFQQFLSDSESGDYQ